ncbi:hypothetical protein CKO38_01915 [Rhodospirillum rubrum]|uniref:GIY-YIG nuclease family protein n=1 Tax=Rhodospirillum rubrum TaxID=1085 RepID=UPI001905B8BC|nr:hypothetical protein [Rhodospirillum rubrum]MBK1675454.1 hypothetical protein [Rhodospirillum rubrum]
MPALGQSDYDAGWVYIAVSRKLGPGLYKIGLSRHLKSRCDSLNRKSYLGYSDWYIAHYRSVSSMRAVEWRLHECLGVPYQTEEGGTEREVFKVPYPKAVRYLDKFSKHFKPAYPVGSPF